MHNKQTQKYQDHMQSILIPVGSTFPKQNSDGLYEVPITTEQCSNAESLWRIPQFIIIIKMN